MSFTTVLCLDMCTVACKNNGKWTGAVFASYFTPVLRVDSQVPTLSYIVFGMAQSEPSSGVKGKAIYNKNLSN